MNIEQIDAIIKKLEEMEEENHKQIRTYDRNRFLLRQNCLTYKITSWLLESAKVFGIILLAFLIFNGAMITSVSDALFCIYATPIISLGTGLIRSRIKHKKKNIKKKINLISTAKTEEEKLEEDINLQILKQQLICKSEIVQRLKSKLMAKKNCLENALVNYELLPKKIADTEEELITKKEQLQVKIEKDLSELDLYVKQIVLNSNFWIIMDNFSKIDDRGLALFLGSIIPMMLSGCLIMIIPNTIILSTLIRATSLFVPFALGFIGTNMLVSFQHKIKQNVFRKVNSTLGDKALPNKVRNSEKSFIITDIIKARIEKQVENIVSAIIELKEIESKFETVTSENPVSNKKVSIKELLEFRELVTGENVDSAELELQEEGPRLSLTNNQ